MIIVDLLGTIRRKCPCCGLTHDCVFFKYQKTRLILCESCLFKKFGVGKITKKPIILPNLEWCTNCERLSMKEVAKSGFVNDSFVVKKFLCSACGKKAVRRIRRWKK